MFKLFNSYIDRYIDSLYKAAFHSSKGFSIDLLTLSCQRILQIIKRAWTILIATDVRCPSRR